MKIEVEIISEEIIKPSSPTPQHLRHHQLSFLDQLAPHVYTPFLYFYTLNATPPHNITQISNHLKNSLSNILTHYYPFAGRVKENLFVNCNDEGIPFFEARVVNAQLSDFITNPSVAELNKLLPFKLDAVTEIPLGVQLNVFGCGGIAVGFCVSHRIADGLSSFTFVKNWAATACGNANAAVRPDFSAASSIFPPRNMAGYRGVSLTNKNKIITKRFVFDGSRIEALRASYADSLKHKPQKRPSRVEALSAFLWNIFVAAAAKEESSGPPRPQTLYTVVYIMDLRSRLDPPLPQHCFGNFYRAATATPTKVTGEECHGLVRQVIEEIENIDKTYLRRFQDGWHEHLDFMKKRMERAAKGELVTLTFSSVCRFPIYEADFGWGKPTWVSMAAMDINNQIVFMDTKTGDGIESYFSLKEEDMAEFEHDKDFQALVCSPIDNVKENLLARL